MSFTVSVDDQVTPAINVLERLISGQDPTLREAAAQGAADEVRSHLEKRDRKPNALGGRRTHYWNDAAAQTFHEVKGDDIRVGIDHPGAALHYHGGTIRPKRAKFLTIPAVAEAHGRTARQFGNLVPIFFDKDTPGARSFGALIEHNDGGDINVIYWLTKRAEIPEDKTVLPKDADIVNAAIDAAEDALEAINE